MRTLHFLSVILVLTVVIGLLASFSDQSATKNHCFSGIVQEKCPNLTLANPSH